MLNAFRDEFGKVRRDSQIESAARAYIRAHYVLRPQGRETVGALEDRIVGVFSDRFSFDWNSNVPRNEIIGDVNVNRVVADVSPLSRRKTIGNGVKATDFDRPTPGSVPVSRFNTSQLQAIVDAGLSTWSNIEKQRLLLDVMKKQQRGIPQFIPAPVLEGAGLSTGAKVGIGFGVLVFVGVAGYLIYRARKKST